MGDMADFYTNQMMDDEGWSPFGSSYGSGPRTKIVECKRCGKSGLEWEDDNGRWVLLEKSGAKHVCDVSKVQQNIANDFEDLT